MTTLDPGIFPSGENLTKAESDLLSAAITGTKDLRADDAELDDPARGANWGADRQIRAAFLIELLTGRRSPNGKSPRIVKLRGVRITGSLDLEAVTLTCTLELENCYIDKAVILNDATVPAIRLPGCHLTNLAAMQSRTTMDLTLVGFTATEGVHLLGAHIGTDLDLTGATLANPHGAALTADRLTVEGNMFCRKQFTVTGEIRLPHTHIGGDLDFTGATLAAAASPSNPAEMRALSADSLTVAGNMFCGFTVTGEVRLRGAHVGGDLDFTGATLAAAASPSNPAEMRALSADSLTVAGDMFCGFTVTGEVRLPGAHIGGHLDFTGATLANHSGTALNLKEASATALLLLLRQQPDGAVDLTDAKVSTFSDDPESWPAAIHLRGFAYDSFGNDDVSVRGRLRWLTRDPGSFAPQLYDQLVTVYRHAGDEQAARKIAVAKQWHRRRVFNPLSWLWYVTVGYGYRTWLAGVWLAVLVALGTWVFSRAYPTHMIAIRSRPPAFHAVAYTLDLILPVISLGQKSAWQPEGSALLYWSWALTGAGWVLTTAVVAGLTGILKRDTLAR